MFKKTNPHRTFATDPRLNELANQLRELHFEFEPEDKTRITEHYRSHNLYNVSFFAGRQSFRVRMYIGGKQRVIGATDDLFVAARWADITQLYFWKYRVRCAEPPKDEHMNFSLAQAAEDLASHTEAVKLLEKIEKHLADFGDLHSAKDIVHAAAERRNTARGELVNALTSLSNALQTNTETNKFHYEQLKSAFHHILERLPENKP